MFQVKFSTCSILSVFRMFTILRSLSTILLSFSPPFPILPSSLPAIRTNPQVSNIHQHVSTKATILPSSLTAIWENQIFTGMMNTIGILTVSGLPSFLPSLCPPVTIFACFACQFKCPPLALILHGSYKCKMRARGGHLN